MAWQIDPAHSDISFSVRHMMIAIVRGRFADFSGSIDFDPDAPANTTVNVNIDVASIDTNNADRDGHLKSPDFFDAENFPQMSFVSKSVDVSGREGKLHGDLTIKGVTKPVTLDVEFLGTAQSPWGNTSAGFSASTKLNRTEWGLTWNQLLETGGVLVGEDIKINIDLELVQQ